jgi:hypothetical protein
MRSAAPSIIALHRPMPLGLRPEGAARLDPRGESVPPGLWASSTGDGRSSFRSEKRRVPPESGTYDRTGNVRGGRQPRMHLCVEGDIHATREADTVTTRDRGGRPERVPRTSRYRTPCVLSRPVWRSGLRSAERDLRDYLAEEAAGTPTVRYQQSNHPLGSNPRSRRSTAVPGGRRGCATGAG